MRRAKHDQNPLPFETCLDHCDSWTAERFGIDQSQLCGDHCFTENRSDYRTRLIEVGTFEFADFTRENSIPGLPPIVLSAQFDRARQIDLSELGECVAAKYWRIGGIRSVDSDLVGSFRVKQDVRSFQTILVHGEGKDSKQEALWHACRRPGYFAAMRSLKDAIFVAPNFSVYTDRTQCQFHQRYNLARSIRFAALLNAMELPVIPSIASAGRSDIYRLSEWLLRQGQRVTHLAVNSQMRGNALGQNLADIREIERASGGSWHWLFFGPCRAEQFASVFEVIPSSRASFVTSAVFQKLGAREDLYGGKQWDVSQEDILRLLVSQIQTEYNEALKGAIPRRRRRSA